MVSGGGGDAAVAICVGHLLEAPIRWVIDAQCDADAMVAKRLHWFAY